MSKDRPVRVPIAVMSRVLAAIIAAVLLVIVPADQQKLFRFRKLVTATGSTVATETVTSIGRWTGGMVFPQGAVTSAVQVGSFTTQTKVRNRWPDSSVKFAVVSYDATSTGAKTVTTIADPGGSFTPTFPANTKIDFVIGGTTWTSSIGSFDGTWSDCDSGAVMHCSYKKVNPQNAGSDHPLLQVFWEVHSYAAGGTEVDVSVQNTKNVSTIDKVLADVTITVNGSTVYTTGSTHTFWTGNRKHKYFWTGATEAVVLRDRTPWLQAKVIPSIVSASAKTYVLTDGKYEWGGEGSYFGDMARHQFDSGGTDREDIQSVNAWDARWIYFGDENYRLASLKNGDIGGEWTWGFTETDGVSIPKVTNATYTSTSSDFNGGGAFGNWAHDACYWKGARIGGCADVNPTDVNDEHMPEMELIPYLLTGKYFYLETLRQHAAWAILIDAPGWSQPDPRFFPALFRGRNGTAGLVVSNGVTREFATPFKNIIHAAWALPDSDGDRSYFVAIAQNNIDYLGQYIRWYIDNSYGGPLEVFSGIENASYSWKHFRANSVTASTNSGGGVTTLTVIGDNSGVGTGTNDHGAQTGDYVDLTGFVTTGATALNGTHKGPITRIDATHFSLVVTTSANTTAEGAYSFTTGVSTGPWRLAFTIYQLDWAIRQGIWTISADSQEFVNRGVRLFVNMQAGISDTDFYTNHRSGWARNFYPAFGYVSGDTVNYYATTSALQADNSNVPTGWGGCFAGETGSNTARLFDSQSNYNNGTHRGATSWNDCENETSDYNEHADQILGIGARLGISGAATALARYRAVSGHTTTIATHPGMYTKFDY
jgi:hypothetical protein